VLIGLGGGGEEGEEGEEGTAKQHDSHLSLPPILSDDILDSVKPALELEGALLELRKAQSI
jgi:hypothetical protein